MNTSTATAPTQPHSPLVPFGKYRGMPLSDVPDDYLMWMGTRDDLRNPLLRHVLHEMARRLGGSARQPEREAAAH